MKKAIVLGDLSHDLFNHIKEREVSELLLFGDTPNNKAGVKRIGNIEVDIVRVNEELFKTTEFIVWNHVDPSLFDLILNIASPFSVILLWNSKGLDNLNMDFYNTVHFKNLTILGLSN